MTTTTTTPCPDWCTTNHDVDPDGGHDGPHWPSIPSLTGTGYNSVSVGAALDPELGVVVYLDAPSTVLSPEQARAAGLALLSAASWAKDHTVTA